MDNLKCLIFKGKNVRRDATCPNARVSDLIECKIMEQRQLTKAPHPCAPKPNQTSGAEEEGGSRITGGEPATPHEFPSILIDYEGDRPYCAGAIIHPEWVIKMLY